MYGFKGRLISGIAALAGVLSALVAAGQAANIVSIVPEGYVWIVNTLPIVSLFIATFSERIQGGASSVEVRKAAAASDKKNEREAMNEV